MKHALARILNAMAGLFWRWSLACEDAANGLLDYPPVGERSYTDTSDRPFGLPDDPGVRW